MNGILDALTYIGDSLDKPGRAVRGLLGGRPEEALAAIPFSDSLGLTDESNRVSGRDLLSNAGLDVGSGLFGTLAGMGVEMATDPLSLVGAGLGRSVGKAASAAATARGPRYSTTVDDVSNIIKSSNLEGDGARALEMIDRMNKINPSVFGEVPPGSSFLGHGEEGLALKSPSGDVVRLGELPGRLPGRPDVEGVLPSTRAVDYFGQESGSPDFLSGIVRSERSPMADFVGDIDYLGFRGDGLPSRRSDLIQELAAKGVYLNDPHFGNLGMYGGRPVVIDPGAVSSLAEASWVKDATGIPGYDTLPVVRNQNPNALMRALLGAIGGDRASRAAIEAGSAGPNFAPLFTVGGFGLGAGAGAAARE